MTWLSVLDRSNARAGQENARVLRDTVWFARQVEVLGYRRFWVAEHHSVPGIAGSAPTVLAAGVAAATSTIRVGTGGVMLPNHRPLVVAEQFGVLESLYPGRIDMGLGRSLGFTNGVRRALGRDDAGDFRAQVKELLGYFAGDQQAHQGVHAWPAEGLSVPAFILATGEGAEIAAELGLPVVVGGPKAVDAATRYWERAEQPYVVVSANIAVAESTEEAYRLLIPEAWSMAYSRLHGVFPPLRSTEDILSPDMTARERDMLEKSLRGQIYGTEEEVAKAVQDLVERSGADEILVTMSTFDRGQMLDSYRRLAGVIRPDRPAAPAPGRGPRPAATVR
ncbi:LLM class flavin-dependent oxidoreductase [Actinocrispum sp. NPDC049592]|uniref:LLM class flavin-dependent oxidoreductase n=1 Tax=Actinocrispum sp. NPDC049592 TaxID=3154835 RepID=UPI00343F5851